MSSADEEALRGAAEDELEPTEGEYADEFEEEGGLGEEIRRQLTAAPWYIASTFLHVVVLLLLMLYPTQRAPEERETVVLTTELPEELEEEEEEEEVIPEPEDPLQEVMKETEAVNAPTEVVTETVVDTQVQIDTEIEMEEVVDDFVGDPTEEEVADASEDAAPNLMGVANRAFSNKAGLSSGFRGGFGKIGRGIRGMVRGGGGGGMGRGLCLIWLLDMSGSMKDDQEAVAAQARDIQELLTDGGRKSMLSGVVTFGANWMVTQELTREASEIQDAILSVEIDKSGRENTCHAISFVCQEIMAKKRGWTKVIVLLTDESASDANTYYQDPESAEAQRLDLGGRDRRLPMIEVALKEMVSTGTRLFVIGKESPFQSDFVREPYIDEEGRSWLLDAKRGPETPRIEVPIVNSTINSGHHRNDFTGAVKAGFGVYDLAYLAKRSKGAYFILDETAGSRRPMTRSERARKPFTLDWEVMDHYMPLVVSRLEYKDALFQQGKWGRKIWQLNEYMRTTPNIGRTERCAPTQQAYQKARDNLRRRKDLLVKLIDVIGGTKATDDEIYEAEQKRQMANIDLYYCVLLADQIITDAWLDAFESYRGPFPPREEGWHHQLRIHPKKGASLSEEEKILFDTRMRRFTEACNDVIRRHSNTPWAVCANWMQGGPRKWGVPMELRYHKWKHGGGGGRPRPKM